MEDLFTESVQAQGSRSLPSVRRSDEELIHAIASGSAQALEVLYQRYHHLFHALVYRIIDDHHITEDLVQEALFTIWCHSTSYSPRLGSARTWLYAIMRHRIIDYLRYTRRHALPAIVGLDEIDESTHADADIWRETWHSFLSVQVLTALTRLCPEQRLVIELIYFQGWTHAQVAAIHHIPLGTVKSRIHLALVHLKHIFTQMGIDEL